MDGMLSQDEINALLNGMSADDSADNETSETPQESNESASDNTPNTDKPEALSDTEKDAVGEISNISMGTAATTLSSLLNQKVNITTPRVEVADWDKLSRKYDRPCVMLQIRYKEGIDGNNVLILKERDVKIITDLMMGGDGTNVDDTELSDLHLSAICEAMNQMMGSAATSLSSMLNKTIDISPPVADLVDLHDNIDEGSIADFLSGSFVKISFKMEIGDLVDSEIMQLYPVSFAKEMCASITKNMEADTNSTSNEAEKAVSAQPAAPQPQMEQPMGGQQVMGQPMMGQPMMGQPMMGQPMMAPNMNQMYAQPVNVQPAQFQAFNPSIAQVAGAENIGLIMDVPLEVTVELGRTTKSIHEILDFAPGTIIELNRIAGEPIDILVNGKYVAKGEVVVIEESFGVRITEIVK